jgi:hypothetical protein
VSPENSEYGVTMGGGLVDTLAFGPDGAVFVPPLLVVYGWVDADDNGILDFFNVTEPDVRVVHNGQLILVCGGQPCLAMNVNTGLPVDFGPPHFGPRACCLLDDAECGLPFEPGCVDDLGDPVGLQFPVVKVSGNRLFFEADSFSEYSIGELVCVEAGKPQLKLIGLDRPAGQQKLLLKGAMTLPHPFDPVLDPVADGAQLRVRDAAGDELLLVDIPPGAYDRATGQGWKGNKTGTRFKWKSKAGVDGITKVAVIAGSRTTPGLVRFRAKGKTTTLAPVAAGQLPLEARLLLDPEGGATGQCGDALFDVDSGRACKLDGKAKKVTCK